MTNNLFISYFFPTLVSPLECYFHFKNFCYTNFLYYYTEGALCTAEQASHTECVMEVSEFFFYAKRLLHNKIFHWKNLLFDFYFVNFLVAKKRQFSMICLENMFNLLTGYIRNGIPYTTALQYGHASMLRLGEGSAATNMSNISQHVSFPK